MHKYIREGMKIFLDMLSGSGLCKTPTRKSTVYSIDKEYRNVYAWGKEKTRNGMSILVYSVYTLHKSILNTETIVFEVRYCIMNVLMS